MNLNVEGNSGLNKTPALCERRAGVLSNWVSPFHQTPAIDSVSSR
jgi:hypothetical protein